MPKLSWGGVYMLIASVVGCTTPVGNHVESVAAPASNGESEWPSTYSGVRDEWFTYLTTPANGGAAQRWRRHEIKLSPAYRELLKRYLWAVNDMWVQRGELRFIVIDEDGKPIEDGDVTREVYDFVKLGSDLEPRFQVTTQKVIGEQRVKLTPKMLGLEIYLKSVGYRWTRFRLPLGLPLTDEWYESERLADAHDLLRAGTVLPPLTADGPVRIVMPFEYHWPSAIKNSTGAVERRFPLKNVVIPIESQTIVSTEEPGAVPAPRRGFYALIDRDRTVHATSNFDRGMLLEVSQAGDYARSRGEQWQAASGGSGFGFARGSEPYAWVLVSEPTRIPPEEVRAENDRSRARVGLPPLYPATQRATTNATSK